MNDRTIWIFRIIAVFILLLFAYLMLSLYTKLRRLEEGERAGINRLQIADCRLQITETQRAISV